MQLVYLIYDAYAARTVESSPRHARPRWRCTLGFFVCACTQTVTHRADRAPALGVQGETHEYSTKRAYSQSHRSMFTLVVLVVISRATVRSVGGYSQLLSAEPSSPVVVDLSGKVRVCV